MLESGRGVMGGGRAARAAAAIAVVVAALALGWATAVPPARADEALSDAQQAEVEALIERYLHEHPEVILDSVRALRDREETSARERAQTNLIALGDQIRYDPATPVAGNPDGDVTVVEFFDYRCGYCKRSLDTVMALIKSDPNIRMVFKEFPILTPESERASRAALASVSQGKYLQFHYALMSSRGTLSDRAIMDIAAEVGLDVERLAKDMESPKIAAQIDANHALARELDINGTPTFIVEDRMFPGAVDAEVLERAIAERRSG